MTVEELKKEALEKGLYLMKPSKTYIKLLPCSCGCKKRTDVVDGNKIALRCKICGKTTEFKNTRDEAVLAWNELIGGKNESN